MSASTPPRRERGLALVMMALLLVFLLVMTAFVVDLGAAYVEKRNDQNAADAGALAGAIEVAFVTAGSDAQDIVDEVMAAVEGTVGSISNAEWSLPSNCPGEPPSGFTAVGSIGLGSVTPTTNCISVNAAFDTLRVRVPVRTVNTAFATVMGIDTIDVTAAAEASIGLPTPLLLPPFAVPTGVRGGDSVCLVTSGGPEAKNETDTEPLSSMWGSLPPLPYDTDGDGDVTGSDPDQIDPCDQRATSIGSGQFGTLLPTTYTRSRCGSGLNANAIIELAIAEGVDHLLSRYPEPFFNPADTREEGALCPGVAGPPFPNAMRVNTGFSSAAMLTCGLMGDARGDCSGNGPSLPSGGTVPGRLRVGSYASGTPSTRFGGRAIDGIAPWNFLLATNTGTCNPSGYTGTATSNWTRFQSCLTGWTGSQGSIFAVDIVNTSRFSFIPLVAQANFSSDLPACGSLGGIGASGGQCVQFQEFAPIYFHRLYGVTSGGRQPYTCDVLNSGSGPVNNNRRPLIQLVGDAGGVRTDPCGRNGLLAHRMAGLVFECGMLPAEICDSRPGPTPGGDIVFDILLTD